MGAVHRARTAVCWTMRPCLTMGGGASRVRCCGLFLEGGNLRLEARSYARKKISNSQTRARQCRLNRRTAHPPNSYAWAAFCAWNSLHWHKTRSVFFGSGLGRRTVQPYVRCQDCGCPQTHTGSLAMLDSSGVNQGQSNVYVNGRLLV
jgi:hypothetical protein